MLQLPNPDFSSPGLFLGKGRLGHHCFSLQGFHDWHSLTRDSLGSTYQRDLCTESLKDLPPFQVVVFALAPSVRSVEAYDRIYRVALLNALKTCRFVRFIYCSSTRVYAENSGGEVVESSPLDRSNKQSQLLVEAEELVRHYASENHFILRLTGLCERLDSPLYNTSPNHCFNRITRPVAAQWLEKATLYQGCAQETVNISEYTGCEHVDDLKLITGKRVNTERSHALLGPLR